MTQQTFVVRPPGPADQARWRQLYAGYAAFYKVQQTKQADDQVWQWINDPGHEVNALLAQDGAGEVVALAHYRTFARPLTASTGCFLDDLYVAEPFRGTGAVDALLEELRNLARQRGWSVVRWITAEDNARARAKYDQIATRTTWITYDMT